MVRKVICNEKGCVLSKMACNSDSDIVPLTRYRRRRTAAKRARKAIKGFGKRRRRRITRKRAKPLVGSGRRKRRVGRRRRR